MRQFRYRMRRSRVAILVNLLVMVFYATEGTHYTQAYAAVREETVRLEEISERMGIPVERLQRQQPGLVKTVKGLINNPDKQRLAEQQVRFEEVVRKHEEQVADNPYRDRIESVKKEGKTSEIEGLLRDLSRLGSLDGARLPELSRKAMLRNLLRVEDEDAFELAPLPEGLPAKAYQKQREMQARLDSLAGRVRGAIAGPDPLPGRNSGGRAPRAAETVAGAVAETPTALGDSASVSRRVSALASTLNGEVRVHGRGRPEPRFTDKPLPLSRLEREAPVVEAPVTSPAPVPVEPARTAPVRRVDASSLGPRGANAGAAAAGGAPASEIVDLAASLGNSPARIFRFVHDSIEYDPKWGQVRSPLGTLLERRGTSWDQAALLCEILLAAGVTAVLEWGEIEIPVELLLALTGTVDPSDAGGVLATGGVPIVLQQIASQTVTARLDHVWVKAQLDYLPNRGVDPVTGSTVPDTWIRMDPSLKRYVYTGGIDVARNVPFGLGDYLQSGTPLSPRRFYDEILWDYIRANNITCTTLEQLKKKGSIVAEAFPYVPGTLRGKVLLVDGEDTVVPDVFRHKIRLAVTNDVGTELVSWETPFADTWGQRVEIAYQGATAADDATIASFGDIFATPPYLVDLKPVVKVAGVSVAEGASIGSARETEVRLTITETSGFVTPVSHETLAGEHHVLALDFGKVPREILDEHQALLAAAIAAGDDFETEAETLFLLGATYLANLGRDLDDISGWTWQRIVKLGTEGLASQRGDVTTTVAGAPLSFRKAERDVDFAKMTLGVFPADGDDNFKISSFELMGGQSSYLEGEVFNQILAHEGIASVSALTRSQREGQALTLVDSGNVNAVLAQINLDADAEAAIQFAVSQGKIAWVAESPITVNQWTGTGYVLQDPATGAAGYLISGELAGGADTGALQQIVEDALGTEAWLEGSPLGKLLRGILGALGGSSQPPDGGADPAPTRGDPVNLANGNFWLNSPDLTVLARGVPIVWTRTYNSRSTHNGPLGYGWTFSYGEKLEELLDDSVVYREADGTEHVFAPDGVGGYVRPPGKHLELTKTASEFTLRDKGGLVSTFGLDGRLLSMSEPNGNNVSLGYGAGGALETVTDAAGRIALTLTYSGAKISTVTDLSGRTVQYGYVGDNLVTVNDAVSQDWTLAYDSEHNLVARADPLGNSDSYAYDSLDRCIEHADPLGNKERFAYGSFGRSAVHTDARGFDTYIEVDSAGRATLQVDPLGNASRSTWDSDNNRTSTVDARGELTQRTFDGSGNLLTETNPLDETTTWTYDPVYSQVLTITDPADHTVTHIYDTTGNLKERSQVVSGTTVTEDFSYNGFGQPTLLTDANEQPVTLDWDPNKGSLNSRIDTLGNTITLSTDALGRVTQADAPLSPSMTLGWDNRDRLTSALDPFGNQTTIEYDDAGREISVITPKGTATSTYDASGRLVATTNVLGHTASYEYDAVGNRTVFTDAKGNRTSATYDPLGRVSAIIDPVGQVWTFGYCADIGFGAGGRGFCDLTDPLGNTTRREYDELGRITKVTDPLGNTTELIYDVVGRKIGERDGLLNLTQFEYDEAGRTKAVVEANGARTEYTYDDVGNLINIKDAELRDWPRTYDELDRLETESDPLGNTTTLAYDALGNLESKLTPEGELITYDYDVTRLTAINLPGSISETFGYDTLGRRTLISNPEVSISWTYDDQDRITLVENSTLGESLDYSYDSSGLLTQMQGSSGTVQYVYDAKNRLVEQVDSTAGVYSYTYDSLDRRSRLSYPNGVVTDYEYDSAGRLLSILSSDPQGTLMDGYAYTYDSAGRRVQMALLHDPVANDYEYDDNHRLVRWDRGPSRFQQYSYDDVGNRMSLIDEIGTVDYAYDIANRLESEVRTLSAGGGSSIAYTWDDNGNLLVRDAGGILTSYQWDPLNRLVGLTDAAGVRSYGYDSQGLRVRETNGSSIQRFLHSFEDIVAGYDATGAQLAYYSHGPGIDEPLAQTTAADGTAYFHRDALGSVTALSLPSGQLTGARTYEPFGGVETSTGPASRYGFTGRELDSSGLMYYRARYLDTATSRFLSFDPVEDMDRFSMGRSGYEYVRNNPVNKVDPLGLSPDIPGDPLPTTSPIPLIITLSLAMIAVFFLLFPLAVQRLKVAAVSYIVAIYQWTYIAIVYGYYFWVRPFLFRMKEFIQWGGLMFQRGFRFVQSVWAQTKSMSGGERWALMMETLSDCWGQLTSPDFGSLGQLMVCVVVDWVLIIGFGRRARPRGGP